jgi:hypothetical protein
MTGNVMTTTEKSIYIMMLGLFNNFLSTEFDMTLNGRISVNRTRLQSTAMYVVLYHQSPTEHGIPWKTAVRIAGFHGGNSKHFRLVSFFTSLVVNSLF